MDSCISHGEFVLANNVLREYNEIKEGKKIFKLLWNTLYENNGNLLCQP